MSFKVRKQVNGKIICGCARPTFLFLRKITLTKSVDTTMLTFFFFMFFNLNSYCEGRIDRINNKSKSWIKANWLQYYPVWLALNIFMVLQRWSSMKRRDHTDRSYLFSLSSSPEENWDGVNIEKLSVSLSGSFLSFQRLTSQREADMCAWLTVCPPNLTVIGCRVKNKKQKDLYEITCLALKTQSPTSDY